MILNSKDGKNQIAKTNIHYAKLQSQQEFPAHIKSQFYWETKPQQQQNIKLYCKLLIVRFIVAIFLIRTFHKGDEYFQGPEIGHYMVYGRGQKSWEWTFKDPVRSPLYPGFFAIGYYLANLFGLSQFNSLISILPYLQQSFVAATFDFMLLKLNNLFNEKNTTEMILFLNYSCWVTLMYFSRTYVNTLETVLGLISFYLWYKRKQNKNYDLISRILVVLNFAMRGTSVIFWMVIWPYELLKYESHSISAVIKFIKKNLITIVSMLGFSILVSSIYYKKILWVDYNFFYYNVLENWSCLAGTNQFQAFFLYYQWKILNFFVFIFLWGLISLYIPSSNLKQQAKNQKFKQMLLIGIPIILILSCNSHKQLRFILPFVPFILIYTVKGYLQFPWVWIKKVMLVMFVLTSAYNFWIRNIVIGRGPIEVMTYIRDHPKISNLYLMTGAFGNPMHSFVHRNISIHMITHPYDQVMSGQKTQLQVFYSNPTKHLKKVLSERHDLTHILFRTGQAKIPMQQFSQSLQMQYEYNHHSHPNQAGGYSLWRVIKND